MTCMQRGSRRERGGGRRWVKPTVLMGMLLSATAAQAQFSTIRPAAVPLITRTPYVNTWVGSSQPGSNGWPAFWTGGVKAITIMASVDGKVYLLMGRPPGVPFNATETNLTVTPTQSIYQMQCGGAQVTLDFLSPVEANDLRRLSMPLSDIIITAKSTDGATHAVKLYGEISAEWAHGDSSAPVNWNKETVARSIDGGGAVGNLNIWEITPNSPSVLTENNEYPSWGTAVFASPSVPGLTTQSGPDSVVRPAFINAGVLANTNDTNQPRPINNNWPVFAYCLDAGNVGAAPSAPLTLILGHVRNPAVSYLGANVPPLWLSYFPNFQTMLAFACNDVPAERARSNSFDARLTDAATRVGGAHYAGLIDLALRQAFAGTELVGTASQPQMYLKEISSSGNVSTVDVCYPSFPAYLYTNPTLVRLCIDPLIAYAESGHWPQVYAEHDLGAHYPNADGHNDGGGENMPVEESADMLIMADAYMMYNVDKSVSAAYGKQHYRILKQWADYLLATPAGVTSCNALDPQFQNQTDDFTGSIAHSSNLALKAIIAVGAMGQISARAGYYVDSNYYNTRAHQLIGQWVALSQNSNSTHLLLQYREAANAYSPDTTGEPDTAWSLKYNAFADKMLTLNLIPASVLTEEAKFYSSQRQPYGIQLDYRNSYTKIDWELFTAASTDNLLLRQNIIDEAFSYANTTNSGAPLSDWYEPLGDNSVGFGARPVVGGLFAPLVRRAGPFPSPFVTYRIVNESSGLVARVNSPVMANGATVIQSVDNGAFDQAWSFRQSAAGVYRLRNKASGKMMTLLNQVPANGAGITQGDDNGAMDNLWSLLPNIDGSYRVRNAFSGRVLAGTPQSSAPSNPLTQWDDNGATDQTWTFWPNF